MEVGGGVVGHARPTDPITTPPHLDIPPAFIETKSDGGYVLLQDDRATPTGRFVPS